jgi:glycosyltransferase involved in cell wall biosynthesis
MKIWIFQTGEPLHTDCGMPRPMRAMNLADALVSAGHSVEIWSSAFYHQEKRHRSHIFKSISVHERLTVHLIPSMGYQRNIGLERLIDHAQMAFQLWRLLRSGKFNPPDLAFVGYPPIEVAWVMLRWLNALRVPSVIDVKDQWPSLFVEAVPPLLQYVAKVIFLPYFWLAKNAMRNALAITSMSSPFLEWALNFCGRPRHEWDSVLPLVPSHISVTEAQIIEARQWWANAGIDLFKGRYISFVGSLSQAFDFSTLRVALERLHNIHPDCKVVICGSGPEEKALKLLFSSLPNVFFPGWIDAPKTAVLMQSTIATIAPYCNTSNFQLNIPNKILDSFSFGQPVVTALRGSVEKLILEEGVGIICTETADGWLNALCSLLEDEKYRMDMSKRASKLYSERYKSQIVYGDFVKRLEYLVKLSHER